MIETLIGLAAVLAVYLLAPQLYHPLARRWLCYWHGFGAANQYMFYRCQGCRGLVPFRRIAVGGCRCQESNKLAPAMLSRREKAVALYVPWAIR